MFCYFCFQLVKNKIIFLSSNLHGIHSIILIFDLFDLCSITHMVHFVSFFSYFLWFFNLFYFAIFRMCLLEHVYLFHFILCWLTILVNCFFVFFFFPFSMFVFKNKKEKILHLFPFFKLLFYMWIYMWNIILLHFK